MGKPSLKMKRVMIARLAMAGYQLNTGQLLKTEGYE
jgi:hypothetical protein